MKLRNTKTLVKAILEQNKDTRSSDMQLYFEVCKRLNPEVLNAPFSAVIMNLDLFHLPPFESVRRSRQKVQAECPHLAACEEVQMYRAEYEEEYRDFAKG